MSRKIKSLQQIREIEGRIYVRWSVSFDLDKERGYSLRFGTQREAGISVCEIKKEWADWRILRQLQEYRFCGGSCRLITGNYVGRGGDNEELIRDIELIGTVSENLLAADWKSMKLEIEIEKCKDKLSRVTDPFAVKIYEEELEKLMEKKNE
jgi:hypothetical protein